MDRLTPGQVRELRRKLADVEARHEVLARIDARVERIERCLHCAAGDVLRWGETRSGVPRLRCKCCRRTFSAATGTALARVRLPEKFGQVLDDLLGAAPRSCRAHAARLGVDKTTVWRWRMRILAALRGLGAPRLGGIVEADEKFFRESRKGSREGVRHAREPARFPRPDRRRWRAFRRLGRLLPAGLSKWQIPVLTLADRAGGRRADLLPDRRAESLVAVLDAHVGADVVLCSDGDGAYGLFARTRQLLAGRGESFSASFGGHLHRKNHL